MQEVPPGEAQEPAQGQGQAALPGLRLSLLQRIRLSLPASLVLAVLSGVVLSFSQPPVDLGPIAFVALVPLLALLRGVRPRRALLLGFVFGFANFGSLLYWIISLTVLGWFALSLASSAYAGLFALFVPVLWRERHPVWSAIGWAAVWTITEFVRSMWPLGGFTWGGLGYSQVGNGLLLPLATITGVWGVSFVVALVNGFVLLALERLKVRRLAAAGLVGASLAAVMLPALSPIPAPHGPRLDVAIVQGNDIQARLQDSIRVGLIASKHATLHVRLASNPPDLAVWPEDAVDLDPTLYPGLRSLVTGAIRLVGVPTLVGIIAGLQDGHHRLYNQSILYNGDGQVVERYTKRHLVPFGEYVPWRRELSFLKELQQIPYDFTPGTRANLLRDGVRFANVICYENSFPSLVRPLIDDGAGFLVVSTNNASYGRTGASRQHLAMSQMRAVENGRWVVHAAVSGISAFIDPHGHVHRPTGLYERIIDRRAIEASTARTFYTRFGDYFPWIAIAMTGFLLLIPRRRRRRSATELPAEPRTLVVIPTYNERVTIESVITRVLAAAPTVDVLVVDDGSPDGTGAIVRDIAVHARRVRILERPRKAGLAAAYAAGFRRAIDEGYDLVVEMDADLSHLPEELPALLDGAREFDLTIGSRYVPGGGVENWGVLRRALSRGGNAYAQLALGFDVRDSTSGFRVFRVPLLLPLLERGIRADGYGFQIELAYESWRAGYAVGEVPITFREREHGHSKISRRIVIEALWLVTVWGVRDRLALRRRRRVERSAHVPPRVEPPDGRPASEAAPISGRP